MPSLNKLFISSTLTFLYAAFHELTFLQDQLPSLQNDMVAPVVAPTRGPVEETPNQSSGTVASLSTESRISEEQKARMEANRLKALERAAARARQPQAT